MALQDYFAPFEEYAVATWERALAVNITGMFLCCQAVGRQMVAQGGGAVVNMRVGFSDARFYRLHGVPSLVYGPTPYNMGGADEYVTLDDLFAVFYVHAMTAFDFLSREG